MNTVVLVVLGLLAIAGLAFGGMWAWSDGKLLQFIVVSLLGGLVGATLVLLGRHR